MNPSFRSPILACLLGLAFWLSQTLIYEPFVVPHLADWKAIPIVWWVAVFVPEAAVCISAVWAFRHIRDAIVFCVLGGFILTTCQFLAGMLSRSAHHKAIEGGLLHFGIQFFVVTLLVAGVVGLVSLVRIGVTRVLAG